MSARWRAVCCAACLLLVPFGSIASAAYESPIAVDQRRSAEQTLLTYPEWFLVHSPAEYATFIANQPSHDFPFLGHVRQLWSGYADVTREQWREGAPANAGYHVMILVIATSTTVEYVLRSAYENTIGRLGWFLGASRMTEEDRYAAKAAQDYVDFIRKEPWYLFDFGQRLRGLWTDVPMSGHGFIRKVERRYALTTEYALKAVYGRLIEKATRVAYEQARMTTQVVVDGAPASLPPSVRPIATLADGRAVLELPRYEDFRPAATALARSGSHLTDIAGNGGPGSRILVTVWTRDTIDWPDGTRVIFEQPLLTMPGMRRVGALIAVDALSDFLVDASDRHASVEHVYDY